MSGQHDAIIGRELWDEVQARLADNTQGDERKPRSTASSLLAGLVFDEHGEPLVAEHASKPAPGKVGEGKIRYRYYVSKCLRQAGGEKRLGVRMPAQPLEDAISQRLAAHFDQPVSLISLAGLEVQPCEMERFALACEKASARLRQGSRQTLRRIIAQIEVGRSSIIMEVSTSDLARYLKLQLTDDAPETLHLTIEAQLRRSGKIVRLVEPSGKPVSSGEPQPHIVRLLQLAHRWWKEMQDDQLAVTEMADRHDVDRAYVSRVIRLAFLAPKIVEQILAGEQPADMDARTLLRLNTLPLSWEEQERRFLAA